MVMATTRTMSNSQRQLRYVTKIHGKIGESGCGWTTNIFFAILCLCLFPTQTSSSQLSSPLMTSLPMTSPAKACSIKLPSSIRSVCVCQSIGGGKEVKLVCKGLTDTAAVFEGHNKGRNEAEAASGPTSSSINSIAGAQQIDSTEEATSHHRGVISKTSWSQLQSQVTEMVLKDSDLGCANLHHFNRFAKLQKLSYLGCQLHHLGRCSKSEDVAHPTGRLTFELKSLVVSDNSIEKVLRSDLPSGFLGKLRHMSLKGNSIRYLEPIFAEMTNIVSLDLSNNLLDESIDPQVFKSMHLKSLTSLDISGNAWHCSPDLSWLYDWSRPLVASGSLANEEETRCDYGGTRYSLLLVMEHYQKYVLPSCPLKDRCKCQITFIQKTMVMSTQRAYKVHVSCVNKKLTHFPKLPKHTATVDLTGNRLNDSAFSTLKVAEHNYGEVENLTLDSNLLETLPEKLLKMNLQLRFSAKNNKLRSISYDFSERLIRVTQEIHLSKNPWLCSCSSQITDRSFVSKLRDKDEMTCGPDSPDELQNKKIISLDQDMLCPPERNGEAEELLLKLLCCILAILIVLVLTKLGYDYTVYRRRGQLPWLALKMP